MFSSTFYIAIFQTIAFRTMAMLLVCLLNFLPAEQTFAEQVIPSKNVVARLTPENWKTFAPKGKEVDAIYGDYVIENEFVRAVIAMPKSTRNANMTVRKVGGCLIDFVSRQHESDQLSAFYLGRQRYAFQSWKVVSDGKTIDMAKQTTVGGENVAIIVSSKGDQNLPAVDVEYSLSGNLLLIRRTFKNESKRILTVRLEDSIRLDGTASFLDKKGDFLHAKEYIEKTPNGTNPVYTIQDLHWEQAYAFFAYAETDFEKLLFYPIQSNSAGRISSLRYMREKEKSSVRIKPGESFSMRTAITVARNAVELFPIFAGQGLQISLDMPRRTPRKTTIEVQDKHGVRLDAALHVSNRGMVDKEEKFPVGWMKVSAKSSTPVELFPTEHVFKVVVNGRQALANHSIKTKGQKIVIKLDDYESGILEGKFTDGKGNSLPCKIQIIGLEKTATPMFAPLSADFAVDNLRYAPQGKFRQVVQAGKYKVIVSRGPEYDALFTEVTVEPGKVALVKGTLKRVVQTDGWVSCDFHSHSSPSGDNTGSQLGRVLNLVCEHVEFGPCTEHNRISSYQPHIRQLGIEKEFASVTGMELTGGPLPLNHQNTFPLIRKPHTQDGGGPITDRNIEMQIERLALWDNNSEKLIQQDHPDIGNLFYDKNGDGVLDEGFKKSIPFIDAMEIHPISLGSAIPAGKKFEDVKHRVFNWLQLLNQGHRITGVVNTDAHYNKHGSGGLRIWVKSPTDMPAKIKTLDIVRAAENRQVVMSNGPYLEVTAHHAVSNKFAPIINIGGDLKAESGFIQLAIKVQCPNWFDINHVVVLANGRPLKEFTFSRKTHPESFGKGVVKFDQTLSLQLKEDTHLVVLATHTEKKLGELMGNHWGKQPPTAISNPIFVDVDKEQGFQHNKDTLGFPLPVKRRTRKTPSAKPSAKK